MEQQESELHEQQSIGGGFSKKLSRIIFLLFQTPSLKKEFYGELNKTNKRTLKTKPEDELNLFLNRLKIRAEYFTENEGQYLLTKQEKFAKHGIEDLLQCITSYWDCFDDKTIETLRGLGFNDSVQQYLQEYMNEKGTRNEGEINEKNTKMRKFIKQLIVFGSKETLESKAKYLETCGKNGIINELISEGKFDAIIDNIVFLYENNFFGEFEAQCYNETDRKPYVYLAVLNKIIEKGGGSNICNNFCRFDVFYTEIQNSNKYVGDIYMDNFIEPLSRKLAENHVNREIIDKFRKKAQDYPYNRRGKRRSW